MSKDINIIELHKMLREIIHNNVYHEMRITKETKWKTGLKPIAKYSQLQTVCTKDSNPLGINLLTHQTRKLRIILKRYYLMIGIVPRIHKLLKITIPSSGDDLLGMKLINEGINIFALPVLLMHKEKCN